MPSRLLAEPRRASRSHSARWTFQPTQLAALAAARRLGVHSPSRLPAWMRCWHRWQIPRTETLPRMVHVAAGWQPLLPCALSAVLCSVRRCFAGAALHCPFTAEPLHEGVQQEVSQKGEKEGEPMRRRLRRLAAILDGRELRTEGIHRNRATRVKAPTASLIFWWLQIWGRRAGRQLWQPPDGGQRGLPAACCCPLRYRFVLGDHHRCARCACLPYTQCVPPFSPII